MVMKAWEWEPKKGWLHCIHNQEADREQVEPGFKNLRLYCPSNLVPPVWLHLLKISGLFLVAPCIGDQACQHMSLWGTPYAQATTIYLCCFEAKQSQFLKLSPSHPCHCIEIWILVITNQSHAESAFHNNVLSKF